MPDLPDATRWVGVFVALLGAFAVSPEATGRLVGRSLNPARKVLTKVRLGLAHVFPALRPRHGAIRLYQASLIAPVDQGQATGWVWRRISDDATVEQKVERLREHTEHLRALIEQNRQDTDEWLRQHNQSLSRLNKILGEQFTDVRDQLRRMDEEATQTDARALPLVGLGVVLSGLPDEIGALPPALWWLVMAVAIGVAMYVVYDAARLRSRARRPA